LQDNHQPVSKSPWRRWSLVLRLAIAGALLAFLLSGLDYEKMGEVIRQARPLWLWSAFFLLIAIRLLMGLRWYVVLKAYGIVVSLPEVLDVFFTSMFFGQMLPGLVGGDLVRGYRLMKSHGQKKIIAASLLFDRLLGVSMVLVFAFAGIVWAAPFDKPWGFPAFAIVLAGAVALFAAWYFSKKLIPVLQSFQSLRRSKAAKLYNKLLELAIVLADTGKLKSVFPAVLMLSAVVMVFRCLVFYALFQAFGAEVEIMDCLAFIPLVFLVLMIPITLGGLGVREGALVVFFSSVTPEVSVSVGLVSYVLLFLISIPGAVIWLLRSPSSKDGPVG
jgi:hypothetical protein